MNPPPRFCAHGVLIPGIMGTTSYSVAQTVFLAWFSVRRVAYIAAGGSCWKNMGAMGGAQVAGPMERRTYSVSANADGIGNKACKPNPKSSTCLRLVRRISRGNPQPQRLNTKVERFLNEQGFEASMLSKRVLLVPTTTSYELNVVISLITAFCIK